MTADCTPNRKLTVLEQLTSDLETIDLGKKLTDEQMYILDGAGVQAGAATLRNETSTGSSTSATTCNKSTSSTPKMLDSAEINALLSKWQQTEVSESSSIDQRAGLRRPTF